MRPFFLGRARVVAVIFLVLGAGALVWYVVRSISGTEPPQEVVQITDSSPTHAVIGSSVEGRNIDAYTYGDGTTRLAFVGGIHGGYEWNSVLLAYALIDYLKEHPEIIPEDMSVTVIPDANPDGVYAVTGTEGRFTTTDIPADVAIGLGRFNAHSVDLNRNFGCKWQPESTWQNKVVSAGSAAFSEPEAKAIRNFVLQNNPKAVVFFHSKSNAVYASECEDGILPNTLEIMDTYARASGYPAVDSFDAYAITGDAEGWLASIGIPAITVELKTRDSIEWERNLAGIKALFEYYKK